MKLKAFGLVLIVLLLNICAYAGGPKGLQVVRVIKAVRMPAAPAIGMHRMPTLYRATTVSAISKLPRVNTTLNVQGLSTATGISNMSVLPNATTTISNVRLPQKASLPVQKPEVLVVNPRDFLKKSPYAIEVIRGVRQLTDLSYPDIAEQLDRLMQRHPEILNNPEYNTRDAVHVVGQPDAPYTADQIAMMAAIENQPQWTCYAAGRAGHIGDSVYYALKNGHEDLANWILQYYEKSINDALYEALVLGDMKMAEHIYFTYDVDVNKTTDLLESSLLVRMSEKSADGVNWLLDHGAILSRNNYSYNELNAAIDGDRPDVLDILHDRGMDFSGILHKYPVFFHPQCVEKLIALGVPVDEQTVRDALEVSWQAGLTQSEREAAEKSYGIVRTAFHEQTAHRVNTFLNRYRSSHLY